MSEKLQQAIQLIKEGKVQAGRQMLAAVLAEDPRNETAWLWLAGAVDTDEQRLYCVKQVLKINPNNQSAQQALASLEGGLSQPDYDAATDRVAEVQTRQEPVATEQTPASPEAPSDRELVELVVRQFGKGMKPNDIIFEICKTTGMNWAEAEAFVHDVESSQRQRIARRQAPILLIVGLFTIVAGAALALPNISFLIHFFQEPTNSGVATLLATPYLLRKLVILVVGLSMAGGGLLGILWMLVPSSKGTLPATDMMGQGRTRYESIDDVVDVGVWLAPSDGIGSPARRRRRGTRLF